MKPKKNPFLNLPPVWLAGWLLTLPFAPGTPAQPLTKEVYRNLKYRYIGPDGNRVIAVVGEPGNNHVVYAGAASGGIFKTTDGGLSWKAIFDEQAVSSVGSLAIAPSDPNVVWAGTGETFIRSNISLGNGIYKSTDAGKTWQRAGLENTGRIGRILIHPQNPDVVYAAALGHCYGPQPERGVFRTLDGGKTWERVLFVDENTGVADLAMDPNNPRILIAGAWQLDIKTWGRVSGGPGSGLFLSRDGGTTWKRLAGSGLPKSPVGKIGVAYAPSNSNRIYALIETDQNKFDGVLFRSDDAGASWKVISRDHHYTQRPHYYTRVTVAPDNENEAYFSAFSVYRSLDGGKTSVGLAAAGGDDHDLWIDPRNPNRLVVGNDGGVSISLNRGQSWFKPDLPIAQMYHVAVDNQVPYNVYGNRQDGPSYRGPSNSRMPTISTAIWHPVGGGESGFTYPDPVDNHIVWSASYDGVLTRYDGRSGQHRDVRVWPESQLGYAPSMVKYRWNWTLPIHISPHDHHKVYVGSQYLHVTTDGGGSWREISPDLTTNDQSKLGNSGGLTVDNLNVDYGCTLFAIAESPLEKDLIWTGSNDGQVQLTRDGGKTWANVTKNLPGLPAWGTISNIEPSRHQPGTAYLSVDLHQVNNRDPFAYKTADYGKTWKKITNGIPQGVLSYVHVIREDPVRKGLLYLGTENALYLSYNDGQTWLPLQNNLPHAPVHWLAIQEHFHDLVVATYGRGFYILDDLTPLRALNDQVLAASAHLFTPRPAYRFRDVSFAGQAPPSAADGANPEYGALIHYYLKDTTTRQIELVVLGKADSVIRKLKPTKLAGINRLAWDLRHEDAKEARLRTLPLGFPGWEEAPERMRLNNEGWRAFNAWNQKGVKGPLVAPGTYRVRLTVDGQTFTQAVEVRPDPHSTAGPEELQEQTTLALEARENVTKVAELINDIEWQRKQLADLKALSKENKQLLPLADSLNRLERKFIELEQNLYLLTVTGTPGGNVADNNRGPDGLYARVLTLANGVQIGDFKPTRQQYEVHRLNSDRVKEYRTAYRKILDVDVNRFNQTLKANTLSVIVPTY
ncbi:MAG: sialidase [Ferruginibacter sp.]|nr:sialidase [Cytophagales bacterium]